MTRFLLTGFVLFMLSSSPAIAQCDAGDMLFNKDHDVMQWCDGNQWIGLPKPPGGGTWSSISANGQHSCGVTTSGEGYCWGYNVYGQLGWGSSNSPIPGPVSGDYRWTSISTGEQHSCGVTTTGEGYCWGRNYRGELGNGQSGITATSYVPVLVLGEHNWASINAGSLYSCGVTTTGEGYCWGEGTSGKLGQNSTASSNVPVLVAGSHIWSSINAGTSHTCGVTTTGDAYCWGLGSYGRLGNGGTGNSYIPVLVSGGYTWSSIAAGEIHSCGVTIAGDGYCWGRGAAGALGFGGQSDSSSPTMIADAHKWSKIGVGSQYSCGLTTGGQAYCWGSGTYGRLGNGATASSDVPVPVSGELELSDIGVSLYHACAVGPEGAKCWGRNAFGQLGNSDSIDSVEPVAVQEGSSLKFISAGNSHGCGVTAEGPGFCWGNGSNGRLGYGDTGSSFVPKALSGDYPWSSIDAGDVHSCGVTTTGDAYCWGEGDDGRLGSGSVIDRNVPTAVSGGLTWSAISAGGAHSCGVTTAGEAYCWGNGKSGQLGTSATSSSYYTSNVPAIVAGSYVWTSISAGGTHSCGVTTTGEGYCWGFGAYGRLGNGDVSIFKDPQVVSGGYSWASISTTSDHTCGVTADGDGYCWGRGLDGRLGNGDDLDRSIPTPIFGERKWAHISAGTSHTCGVTTTGEGYCWGSGADGRLGNGDTVSSNVPVLVSDTIEWATISAGAGFTCGIDQSGRWYCWGLGSYGRLGNGSQTSQSFPGLGTGSIISASCANGSAGDVLYNADYEILQWCDGSRWIGLPKPTTSGSGCGAPSGDPGDVLYNADHAVMQWCDGSQWIAFPKPISDTTAPIWVTAEDLPAGSEGEAYNATVVAIDDGGSVAYGIVSTDPGWLLLNPATGSLSGTPDTDGTVNVTIRAEDPSGNYTDRTFTIEVAPPPDTTAPSWVTAAALPGGTEGEAYSASVEATDDSGSVAYSIEGSAPGWLALDEETGALTGIPDAAGTINITIRTEDPSGNYTDRTFTIEIESAGAEACETGPVGTVCSDGAKYAGTLGSTRLYAAPADESGSLTWNNGSSSWTVTGATSLTDGLANTNILAGLSDAGAPYRAAQACRARGANWYLPALNELNVLYTNRSGIGGFNTSGSWYWSSSENSSGLARIQRFSDGSQASANKDLNFLVRCVRQEAPPDTVAPDWVTAATLPVGTEGEAYSASVEATDDSGSVAYSIEGSAPNWLVLDEETGDLTGTPEAAGSYEITIRAEDPSGNYADRTFTIAIEPSGPVPCGEPLVMGCIAEDGAIYAGDTVAGNSLAGAHMFVAPLDEPGTYQWKTSNTDTFGSGNTSDGFANTVQMALTDLASHPAAAACRARGADWYLPAPAELLLLRANRDSLETEFTSQYYWSSSNDVNNGVSILRIDSSTNGVSSRTASYNVRCVRSEQFVPATCETGAIGTVCPDGAVYAGNSRNNRIYVAAGDESGSFMWKTTDTTTSGPTRTYDGYWNTDKMIAAGAADHPAAAQCRSKGADWYLPARDELGLLYINRSALSSANLPTSTSLYFSSTQNGIQFAYVLRFSDGYQPSTIKNASNPIRCVRR